MTIELHGVSKALTLVRTSSFLHSLKSLAYQNEKMFLNKFVCSFPYTTAQKTFSNFMQESDYSKYIYMIKLKNLWIFWKVCRVTTEIFFWINKVFPKANKLRRSWFTATFSKKTLVSTSFTIVIHYFSWLPRDLHNARCHAKKKLFGRLRRTTKHFIENLEKK